MVARVTGGSRAVSCKSAVAVSAGSIFHADDGVHDVRARSRRRWSRRRRRWSRWSRRRSRRRRRHTIAHLSVLRVTGIASSANFGTIRFATPVRRYGLRASGASAIVWFAYCGSVCKEFRMIVFTAIIDAHVGPVFWTICPLRGIPGCTGTFANFAASPSIIIGPIRTSCRDNVVHPVGGVARDTSSFVARHDAEHAGVAMGNLAAAVGREVVALFVYKYRALSVCEAVARCGAAIPRSRVVGVEPLCTGL